MKKYPFMMFALLFNLCLFSQSGEVLSDEIVFKILDRFSSMQTALNYYVYDVGFLRTTVERQRNGEVKVFQQRGFRRGRNDTFLTVTLAPEAVKGQGWLGIGEDGWTYEPLTKTFIHSIARQNYGNDFSNFSDLTSASKEREMGYFEINYRITSAVYGKLGKLSIYKIELTALASDISYPKIVACIDKKHNLIVKLEHYNANNEMCDVRIYRKYVRLPNDRIFPADTTIVYPLECRKVNTVYSDFDFSSIPDRVFTKEYLERINE